MAHLNHSNTMTQWQQSSPCRRGRLLEDASTATFFTYTGCSHCHTFTYLMALTSVPCNSASTHAPLETFNAVLEV